MAQRNRELSQSGRSAAPGCEKQSVAKQAIRPGGTCLQGPAQTELEPARRVSCGSGDATIGSQSNAGCFRSADQTINNRARRISNREYPPIGFTFELYPAMLEPRDGVLCLKAVEGGDQFVFATRKPARQFPGLKARVSDIATTAARDTNFG